SGGGGRAARRSRADERSDLRARRAQRATADREGSKGAHHLSRVAAGGGRATRHGLRLSCPRPGQASRRPPSRGRRLACSRGQTSPRGTAGAEALGLAGRAAPELVLDCGRVEAARGEQDVAVKPEVGELLDEALVALGRAGERRFDPFLANLARG